MQVLPIRYEEKLKLPSLGLPSEVYKQQTLSMESERYICVKEIAPDGSTFFDIINLSGTPSVQKKPIKAEAAIMHPKKNFFSLRNNQNVQLSTDKLKAAQILSYNVDSSGKWCVLYGVASPDGGATIDGYIQLYSMDRKQHQIIEGYAPCFGDVSLSDPTSKSIMLACVGRKSGEANLAIHLVEVSDPRPGQGKFMKKEQFQYPPEVTKDFPVLSHISDRHGILFIVTKMGYLFMYEMFSAAMMYRGRLTNEVIFTACKHTPTDGMLCVNKKGSLLLISVDDTNIVEYIRNYCKHLPDGVGIAYRIAMRTPIAGTERLFVDQFNSQIANGDFAAAAKTAVAAPNGMLRTPETIQILKSLPVAPGQPKPIMKYFATLLDSTKLNGVESIELVNAALGQNRRDLVETWIKGGKLECTRELGELVRQIDPQLALGISFKSNNPELVVQGLVEAGQPEQVFAYARKMAMNFDYLKILDRVLESGLRPQAVAFGKTLCVRKPGEAPMAELNAVFETFLRRGATQEAVTVMLEALSGNRPEDAYLQTRLFEVTLTTAPKIAEGIFQMNMFTCYDKPKVARLCEQAGLMYFALLNYTDIADIRRVIVNADKMKKEQVIEFLGTLEPSHALMCMFDIVKANPQSLGIVVDAAVKYNGKIPTAELVKLFDASGDHRGQYFFLGQILNTTDDPEIHYKYIESAVTLGELKEVERVIRETSVYDPVKVKELLFKYRLPDPKPLIYLCDIHGFIEELTQYIAKYKIWKYLELYLYRVNPKSTAKVMGTLLDMDCDESIYKPILNNARACPIGPLVEEFEKRNKLRVLLNWLEARASEGNETPELYTALAKIYVDTGREPQTFLINNQLYDPKEVGKYCETRNAHLAFLAYKKAWGNCDAELIELSYKNMYFNLLAQYLVERQSPDLWKAVLSPDNVHRPKIVEQVIQSALPKTHNTEEVSVAVKAFIEADLPEGLIELLDQLVLHHPEFMNHSGLQTLLILTAIKSDHSRVMDYVNRLDKYEVNKLCPMALENGLYEEAVEMYGKFGKHEEAMSVMLEKIGDLTRAEIYAAKINSPEVWSRLGKAEIIAERAVEAINAYLKAEDPSNYDQVIATAERGEKYEELVEYLLMARGKLKEPKIDGELIYAYAQCQRYTELEDFIAQTHTADLQTVGDRCYDSKLYEAGKIIFTFIGNYARLASCLVHLREFQAAIEAAKKANIPRTWKEVNYACVRARQFRLAAIAGLNVIIHPDHLDDIIEYYEKYGYWEELIKLLESGLTLEEAHAGMFTELGVLLAKYDPSQLMSHLKTYFQKIHVPKLLRACEEYKMWPEAVFLHAHYDQHDRAVAIMMDHSPTAWVHDLFVDSLQKVANSDLHYKSIFFYLREQPMLLNDMLIAISEKLDLPKTIAVVRKTGYLALSQTFLQHVQTHNIEAVNEALNEVLLENDDHQGLRASVLEYDNFDYMKLVKILEKHELLEFRRIAAILYRKNKKYVESLNLSKVDNLHKDAVETALDSKKPELAEHMLRYFISIKEREFFSVCLYTCYELLKPDVVLELTWRFGLFEFAMPYMIQTMREMNNRIDQLGKKTEDIQKKEEKSAQKEPEEPMPIEYDQLMMPGLPQLMAPPEMMMPGFSSLPQLMPAPGMMGMMGMGMGMGMGMDMGGMGMGGMGMGGMGMGGMGMGGMGMGGMGMGMGQPDQKQQ